MQNYNVKMKNFKYSVSGFLDFNLSFFILIFKL